MTNLAARF